MARNKWARVGAGGLSLAAILIWTLCTWSRPVAAGPNLWTPVGPRALVSITARDSAGAVYVVSTATGTGADTHIYKSPDGGQTWAAAGDYAAGLGLALGAPTRLAVSGDGAVLLLLVGNRHSEQDYNNQALLKSTNGGATWALVLASFAPAPLDGVLADLVLDPRDPTRLYTNGHGGFYRSTDGGTTWQLMPGADPLSPYSSAPDFDGRLVVDPADPAHLLAAGQGDTGPFVRHSHDYGATWQAAPAQADLPFVRGSATADGALAFWPRPGGPSYALAVATPLREPGNRALYLSQDGGDTWQRVLTAAGVEYTPTRVLGLDTAPGRAYLLVRTLATLDPATAAPVLSRETLYTSSDGPTWTVVGGRQSRFQEIALGPQNLRVSQADPRRVFGADGLFSADGGQTWTGPDPALPALGLGVSDFAVGPEGWLVASGLHVYHSADAGRTWQGLYTAADGFYSAVTGLAQQGQTLLLYAYPAKVTGGPGGHFERPPVLLRSTDGGATWAPTLRSDGTEARFTFVGAPGTTVYAAIAPAYDYGSGSEAIRSGLGGLYKSTDGGATWAALPVGMVVNNLLVDPAGPAHLLAAGDDGLAESRDAGATWQIVHPGAPVGGQIVAAGGTTLFAYEARGYRRTGDIGTLGPIRGPLYRSTDRGQHWAVVPLPGAPAAYSVDTLTTLEGGQIAIAWSLPQQRARVAETLDGGQTWIPLNGLGLGGYVPGQPAIVPGSGGYLPLHLAVAPTTGEVLAGGCCFGLAAYQPAQAPADPAFAALWQRQDQLVQQGTAPRGWTWGPQPFATLSEPLAGLPGNRRIVQYYDKSRMEVNDPGADRGSPWFVTNGLLTVEMVAGRVQTGLSQWEARPPATQPVAGDGDPAQNPLAPSYAAFRTVASVSGAANHAGARVGQAVTQSLDAQGVVGATVPPTATVTLAAYDAAGGHNIAAPFWEFLHRRGPIWGPGGPATGALFPDWVFVMGRPITEPYWAHMRVAPAPQGDRWVLIQLFERRVLTYTPANAPQWQVEMGNTGLHYYLWRYGTSR
ncbi:MAG TPA: hypothetical protein VKY74_27015 [Chloroflexia bacterium]|nr:hypothetical protein [Chloroflexia bacterium]